VFQITEFTIKILKEGEINFYHVESFLFNMIKQEYGYDYVPKYHWDVVNLEDTYIKPDKNIFLAAVDDSTGELIGTGGLRAYDMDFTFLKDYNPEDTASLCRLFVSKKWRRMGVASEILQCLESFALEKGYSKTYLHTHRTVSGALDFWLSRDYRIILDTHNQLETVHLHKEIMTPADGLMTPSKIKHEPEKSSLSLSLLNPVLGVWGNGK